MNGIGNYILSIAAASIICAVVINLLGSSGTVGKIGKLLTGLFLAITVVKPLLWFTEWNSDQFFSEYKFNAQVYSETGKEKANQELESIIKSEVEAYILDKAKDMNASVTVHVELSSDMPPELSKIILEGNVSPYARQQLIRMIDEDLGVPKENQIWN